MSFYKRDQCHFTNPTESFRFRTENYQCNGLGKMSLQNGRKRHWHRSSFCYKFRRDAKRSDYPGGGGGMKRDILFTAFIQHQNETEIFKCILTFSFFFCKYLLKLLKHNLSGLNWAFSRWRVELSMKTAGALLQSELKNRFVEGLYQALFSFGLARRNVIYKARRKLSVISG